MKFVKQLLKEGISKEEVYERAVDKGLDKKRVSTYLANFPDQDLAGKYKKLNLILVSLVSVWACLGLLQAVLIMFKLPLLAGIMMMILVIAILTLIIYNVYTMKSMSYFILCFFAGKSILNSVGALRSFSSIVEAIFIGLVMLLSLTIIVLAVLLKKKVFPYQNFINSKQADDGTVLYSQKVATAS